MISAQDETGDHPGCRLCCRFTIPRGKLFQKNNLTAAPGFKEVA